MPYEEVGSAARGWAQNRAQAAGQQAGGGGGGYAPGRAGRSPSTVAAMLVLPFLVGVVLMGSGAYYLASSLHDGRGEKLEAWHTQMDRWSRTGLSNFMSQRYSIVVGPPPGPPVPMTGMAFTTTPAAFGEASFDGDREPTGAPAPGNKIHTPDSITEYVYRGTALCPGKPNSPCTITVHSRLHPSFDISTAKIAKQIPGWGQGPLTQFNGHATADVCQWYDGAEDGDFDHPMATFGMGTCHREGPNYGPSCVDERYLDENGCPNDIISTQYWQQYNDPMYGGFWSQGHKKRFTYENGMCIDYTDCFCQGCGYTFKTNADEGIGFTGYGYYYTEQHTHKKQWMPFTQPLFNMTGDQRAAQCHMAMNQAGMKCSKEDVSIRCYVAGGFPKPTCKDKCMSKGESAQYTPAGTLVQTYKLYAPYGHYGSYPVPTTIKDPGTCTWVQTRQVEKLGFAVNENGKFAGGSHWVVHQGVGQWVIDEPIQGTKPFPVAQHVPVQVEIRATDGPTMTGAKITDGCNMKAKPSRCFGLSAKENFEIGVTLLVIGCFLLCCPLCTGCLCMSAVAALFVSTNQNKRSVQEGLVFAS